MTERKISGSWRLSSGSAEYDGELVIDDEEGILALILTIRESEEHPFPAEINVPPLICGTTLLGTKVTLCGCRKGNVHHQLLQYTQYVIYAPYAFWGIHVYSESNLLFTRIDLDMGNIIPWASLSRVENRFDDERTFLCSWTHEGVVSHQRDDGMVLEFSPALKSTSNSLYDSKVVIEHGITISLQYDEPTTWQQVLFDVDVVESLVSLGMHENISVREMKYALALSDAVRCEPSNARSWATGRMGEITVCGERRSEKPRRHIFEYLFNLKQFAEVDGFEHWFENYPKLKPVLDLYLMAFSKKVSTAEIYFLNLIQALETYHARFITDSRKAYRKRVHGFLASISNPREASSVQGFLWSPEQDNCSSKIILKSRLADLFYADGMYPIPYSLSKCGKFLAQVTVSRHYYTHYDAGKASRAFSKDELRDVNDVLMVVLEFHILVLLGFDANEAAGAAFSKIDRLRGVERYFA